MDRDQLEDLKYRQLQKKAKDLGVRANLPRAQLIDELLKASNTEATVTDDVSKDEEDQTSFVSSISSGQGSPGQRFAQFFDDDLVVTPRGASKPRQYLPASGKRGSVSRTSSVLTLPSDSPKNLTITLSSDNETPEPPKSAKKRVSSLMNPTAASAARSRPSGISSSAVTPNVAKATPKHPSQDLRRSLARKSIAEKATSNSKVPDTRKSQDLRRSLARKSMANQTITKVKTPKTLSKDKSIEKRQSVARKSVTNLRSSLVGGPGSIAKKRPSLLATAGSKTAKKVRLESPKKSHIPKRRIPNFAKIHEQQFNKMATLGDYLAKKKERRDALTPGNPKRTEHKPSAPVPIDLSATKPRRSPRNLPQKFVPTVKETNFNFSKSNAGKQFTFTADKKTDDDAKEVLSNVTNKKGFDLKASLAKPLAYRPHKGKLNNWNPKLKQEERIAMIKKQGSVRSEKASLIKGVRMNKRAELMLKRRNIES